MRWRLVLAVPWLFLVLLTSCVRAPTSSEIAAADYGAYPKDFQEMVKRYMATTLKDPYSAQYDQWRGPSTGWGNLFGRTLYGYIVCVNINAKNSYGGYAGSRVHYLMIHNGTVVRHLGGSAEGDLDAALAQKGCSVL